MFAGMGWRVTAALLLAWTAAPGEASAAEIKLVMKGGSFEVSGELRQFDGTKYVIQSDTFGTMSLDASRFDCTGASCPKGPTSATAAVKGDLGATTWMGGSGIGTNYMPELVKSYAAANGLKVAQGVGADPRVFEFRLSDATGKQVARVNIDRTGVTQGLDALAQGKVEAVWTAARLTDEEARRASPAVADLRTEGNEHVFALDAMVVVVARENPVASLSIDNLARIYSGQIKDWSELGLPPGKITLYAPLEEMGNWKFFDNTILKPRGFKGSPDIVRLKTAIEWSDKVAADPLGISFNFIAYIRNAKAVNIEDACGLVTRPSLFTAKTEEYPLARRLHIYTKGQPKTPIARELLAHALSPAGQAILRNADFVDQSPETLDFTQQTSRIAYALNAKGEDFDMALMKNLIADIKPAKRLSITFRFQTNSFTLDAKALSDIDRLRDLLLTPDYASRSVMLIGYADNMGPFPNNLKLSDRRAGAVARALAKASGGKIPAAQLALRAYGELAPVACNDSFEARSLNRRVEVWVK